MKDIPFVWIDGTTGGGKTTLIERLLESNRKREFAVVRLRASDSVNTAEVDNEQQECLRYKAAGAVDKLQLLYPKDRLKQDERQVLEYVRNIAWVDWDGDEPACDALIYEGQNDFYWRSSLRVFVARPLSEEHSLVSRERREVLRFSLEELLDLKILPDADSGESDSIKLEEWENIEECKPSNELSAPVKQLLDVAKNGLPIYGEFWTLHNEYENIMKAAVILINIYGEHERPAADRLIEQIHRLRTDPELKRDLHSQRDYFGKLSIVVCNLADAKDKELAKGLSRIKRPIQEFCPRFGWQPLPV